MDCVKDLVFSDQYWVYRTAAALVGVGFIGGIFVRTLREFCSGFRAFFLAPLGIGRINLLKYGKWAVVTGASDGIGKQYALELASKGLNIVLMSRSADKMDQVAEEIKEKYGCDALVIPVDFSDGFEIYSAIQDQLKDLDIGILVNNVGIYYTYPDVLCHLSAKSQYRMVQVNCQPVVQMTHLVLPQMVKRNGGVIVNLSSVAGIAPGAENTVYCATKVFVDYFSEGLRKEYGSKGIIVQNVAPGMVSTNLNSYPPTNAGIVTASKFTKQAVATIGIQDYTHGCFSHAVQAFIFRRLPLCIVDASIPAANKQLRVHMKAKGKRE